MTTRSAVVLSIRALEVHQPDALVTISLTYFHECCLLPGRRMCEMLLTVARHILQDSSVLIQETHCLRK